MGLPTWRPPNKTSLASPCRRTTAKAAGALGNSGVIAFILLGRRKARQRPTAHSCWRNVTHRCPWLDLAAWPWMTLCNLILDHLRGGAQCWQAGLAILPTGNIEACSRLSRAVRRPTFWFLHQWVGLVGTQVPPRDEYECSILISAVSGSRRLTRTQAPR